MSMVGESLCILIDRYVTADRKNIQHRMSISCAENQSLTFGLIENPHAMAILPV
jgi:hypothetical protein